MKKKIFISGAYGLLGTTLCRKLNEKNYKIFRHGTKRKRQYNFKLTNIKILKKKLSKIKPDIIINLLALTNVNECESDLKKAYNLNIKSLKNLHQYARNSKNNCRLINISTDQVYFGQGPHKENYVNPINNYGLTKLIGELIIFDRDVLILRTNFVVKSENIYRKSLSDWFIESLKNKKKLNLFNNIYFNPLEINYLTDLIIKIMHKKLGGIFNLGSKTSLSKANFLIKIAKKLKLDTKYCIIGKFKHSKKEARRPENMVMDCKKFEKTFKINLPTIENQIEKICESYTRVNK